MEHIVRTNGPMGKLGASSWLLWFLVALRMCYRKAWNTYGTVHNWQNMKYWNEWSIWLWILFLPSLMKELIMGWSVGVGTSRTSPSQVEEVEGNASIIAHIRNARVELKSSSFPSQAIEPQQASVRQPFPEIDGFKTTWAILPSYRWSDQNWSCFAEVFRMNIATINLE